MIAHLFRNPVFQKSQIRACFLAWQIRTFYAQEVKYFH